MIEPELQQKLQKFSGTVLRSAEKQRSKIEAELEKKHSDMIKAKEDEYLAEAYTKIQNHINKIRKEDNERVLHAEMQAKRELLLKREDIINTVFELAEEKIRAYMKTEEYKAALSQKIAQALAMLGDGEKLVYLTQDDSGVFDPACGAMLETVADKGFIGGVKAVNLDKDFAVNYSYYELLNEQKRQFLQKSGLSLS